MASHRQGSQFDMITFRKPGCEEAHHERFADHSPEFRQTLLSFKERGDWFNPSTQAVGSAFQLATDHPIYGTSLRVYDYLGTVRDRGRDYYAFITEQTSGGNGPRRSGRHWASGAISLTISRFKRYVNPAQICLFERIDRDPEMFGHKMVQGESYMEGFQQQLKGTIKHYADDHPGLYEALCGIYLYGVGGDKWQACMSKIWKILQFGELEGNREHCDRQDCALLHELRMAWKDNFKIMGPPPTLPSEPSNQPFGRTGSGSGKVKPSRSMCHFLTGRMICFDAAKHRIEWAHSVARRPLPLQRPQE